MQTWNVTCGSYELCFANEVVSLNNTMDSVKFNAPELSCVYKEYDPASLKLSNQKACTRLSELNWSSQIFQNKSVLDIGCKSGLLSLYANFLGASSVRSVDGQMPLVEHFKSVVSAHNLSIQVEQLGFNDLIAQSHAADIVLFKEVLHYIDEQIGTVDDVIFKLATLTREILYLEAPLITNKASIAHCGKIQYEKYDMKLIIQELKKYFEHVEVVGFTTCFDEINNSKQVQIKASGKRTDYESMRHLSNVNRLDISLSRGNNSIQLLTSPDGPCVIKKLPLESILPSLSQDIQRSLFNTLRDLGGPLLPALPFQDDYILCNDENESVMLFPFVGRLGDYFHQHNHHNPVQNPLKLAVECRRNLSQLPDIVIQAVREKSRPLSLKPKKDLGELFLSLIEEEGLSDFINEVYRFNKNDDRSLENCVVHNDLQIGNMITDSIGRDWIIDLDLMRSGTAYSDFICCAIYNNCTEEDINALYPEMIEINQRSMEDSDIYFSMKILLRWIYVLNIYHKSALNDIAKPVVNGIKTFYKILLAQKEEIICADKLKETLNYSLSGDSFIEQCLDNTRLLNERTDDTSTLLFYAMTALGRFTKGPPVVQKFTELFNELGRNECAFIVQTCSYREQDLAFYLSTSDSLSSLFESSSVQPIETYATADKDRSVNGAVMKTEWSNYEFYEIDKIPKKIGKRHWCLYDLQNVTIIYDTAEFAVLDCTGKPILDLCSSNYQHVYFTKMFREYFNENNSVGNKSEIAVELIDALMIQDLIRQPNYCHWLLDQLPRLRHLEDHQNIIMYKMSAFMKNMIELMDIDSDRVHLMNERTVLKIHRLKIESSMAKHFYHPCQDMNADLVKFVRSSLDTRAMPSHSEIKAKKNVYLSRNKYERRRISNEDELLNVLENYDFHTVYPEELTMSEQIALFRNAEVIVSPHGASLANIVFSENITLIEIFNQNYGTPTFYIMAQLLGYSYQHILGNNPMRLSSEIQHIAPGELQKADIEVNIDKLEMCLAKIFEA